MFNKPIGTSLNEPIGTSLNSTRETLKLKTRTRIRKKPSQSLRQLESIETKTKVKTKRKPSKMATIDENIRKITNFTRKTASRKIGTFMKNHRSKIRLRFLNTICTDSNVCIAFGKEIKVIREFFNDFDFRLMSLEPRIVGAKSENGTVKLLTFEKDGYVANAIFKTSNKKYADNLAYEAFVGRFINKQKIRFPCFLETYGLY